MLSAPCFAQDFGFSTGNPDGKIATASRPDSAGKAEIESADDFVISVPTQLTHATFTGLLTGGAALADVNDVRVEIYRVFPNDSTNPPDAKVPTRVNSPSDVALTDRDSAVGNMHFTSSMLSSSFTASNSVLNGINPLPNQKTLGEGPVTGIESLFDVSFDVPIDLPADHYFFIPQVEVTGPDGEFMWLSAPKPIVGPGTPFTPDLQSWIRNSDLDPDWLRIGTDITGQGPFNGAFSLTGSTSAIPEPSTLMLFVSALPMLAMRHRKRI